MIKEVLLGSLDRLYYEQTVCHFIAYLLDYAIFSGKGDQCYLNWMVNMEDVVVMGNLDLGIVFFTTRYKYMSVPC